MSFEPWMTLHNNIIYFLVIKCKVNKLIHVIYTIDLFSRATITDGYVILPFPNETQQAHKKKKHLLGSHVLPTNPNIKLKRKECETANFIRCWIQSIGFNLTITTSNAK